MTMISPSSAPTVSELRARPGRRPRRALGATTLALALLLAGCGTDSSSPGGLAEPELCEAYSGLPEGWGEERHAGMVLIPGGEFIPGNEHGYPEEQPSGSTRVEAFWMDRTEVTNAQFAAFVEATGYVTEAEREGAGVVFQAPEGPVQEGSWWHFVEGASWRHPDGPDSSIEGLDHHPVVQITHADAQAYARWLGHELPSEAQWEYAARAGGEGEKLERQPLAEDGSPTANFWQGSFPYMNTSEDGHVSRAPVGCYPANGYGLYDMIGNVWEWTRDWYTNRPQPEGTDHWEASPRPGAARVIKGGSFLCADNYCRRYRSTSRHPQEVDLPTAHIGFRTILPSSSHAESAEQ